MEKIKNGGRAFPCDSIVERDDNGHMHGKVVSSGGMTLRDYFAAKAMQALIGRGGVFEGAQVIAYEIADLMLKERE